LIFYKFIINNIRNEGQKWVSKIFCFEQQIIWYVYLVYFNKSFLFFTVDTFYGSTKIHGNLYILDMSHTWQKR